MEFKERLLNEIKSAGLDNFSDRLLNRKLGIYSTFEKREVTKALDELVQDGVLVSVEKGNYTLKDKCDAVSGVLRGNRRGFAFLIRDDGKADLFIPHKGLHGAQSGDKVYVVPVKGTADEGKVVAVIERGKRQLVGEYTSDRAGHGFVVPDDESYFSDVFIPTAGRGGAKNKDKVVVNIYDWDSGKNPVGEITEILGRANTIKGDTLAIIRDHGFYENFSKEALYDAERINKPVDMKEIAKRTDYRDLLTITIDGADAKDFDDAITVERRGDGFVLYVHIADVAHYIKQDGILDTEALKRATSVYLPNMVLPMLPEAVSNGVCSLQENLDRLTLSCVMEIDKTGKVTGNKIVESVIRSNHRMTYDDVQKILDGDKKLIEKYADVYDMLTCARDLERILNAKRRNRGSINFISEEPKFTIKDGKVLDVAPYPYYESNLIIEEFMLLANETVAEFMYHTELPFVYRVHEAPNKEKVLEFKKFVSSFNYNFVVHQSMHASEYQKLLDDIKGTAEERIISKVMLRSMQKAKYTTGNAGHFGLALEYYCHFTSPIRRYPDLTIHRVIKKMLTGQLSGAEITKTLIRCEKAAAISSEREIAAECAERDGDDYFKMLYMADKSGEVYDGIISGVTGFGVFVQLQNTVEGFISLDKLPAGKYKFDEGRFTLSSGKHVYSLGDKIKIKVDGISREIRRVNFSVYEEKARRQ